MNREEVAKLLTQASLVDNRRITEAHVEQWWRILNSLTFEECERAIVEHFRSSQEYLQPKHIWAIVKRHREDQAEKTHSKQLEAAYSKKSDSDYPGKPSNLDEMVAFYRRLAASGEWQHGSDADEVAARVGLTPPQPKWD